MMRPLTPKMKPRKKKHDKLVIHFDHAARREYLTGFQKRKRQRKAKARLEKAKQEKKRKKELLLEKKEDVKKKLEKYGLADDDEIGEEESSRLDHHPDHVVTINVQPDFGLSLSSMVDDDKPKLSARKYYHLTTK